MGLFALLGATLVIFAGSRYLVDPVMAALAPIDDMDDASSFTPDQIEGMRKKLRLDRPVPVQYTLWVWDLLHGHLGNDIVDSQRPIAKEAAPEVPAHAPNSHARIHTGRAGGHPYRYTLSRESRLSVGYGGQGVRRSWLRGPGVLDRRGRHTNIRTSLRTAPNGQARAKASHIETTFCPSP